ncbi:restriction endonuclease subunit S [Histophilus somni]|uniref:restriction endonuclease subunit S n=1 Tax=Histophilus somni TaxID=731 RepID=UPI00201F80E3|nr:restriction endonuclease subunit S [Histophilus somni]
MNNEKKLVPKLRFPEFTHAWEQRKLGDLVQRVVRKNKNLESTLPLTISAQYGLVDQNEFFNKVVASRDVSGYYLIKKGEFAYNKSYSNGFPWGTIKRLDLYPKGVLSTLYILFKPTNVNSDFLTKYYETTCWHSEISKHAAEGARNHGLLNIATEDFFKTKLTIPKLDKEQQKIGTFFTALDRYITIHQRKLENIQKLKKSLLQKMFPKNDQEFPEIRFPEFTYAWEQRKLNQYIQTSLEKNINNQFSKNDVLSVSGDVGIVNQIEFQGRSFAGVSVSNYGIVNTGDIVYTKSPLKANPYGIIKTNKGNPGIVSTLYAVYKPNAHTDSIFVQYYFESDDRLNRYLKPLVNKGAKNDMKVSDDNALIGLVNFPCYKEQQKIGTFFTALDRYITIHQRKLENMQKLKKSLLQQMFV